MTEEPIDDFADVASQRDAKLALKVTAAGGIMPKRRKRCYEG